MAGALTAAIAAAFSGGAVAATDPYFEYTTLLLPGSGTNGAQNNTFLDGSTNNFTITRNGNTTQGTFSPFSQTGWGGDFNTSTTYLTVTDTANLRFGSSNFTIEAWVYRNASGATQTIASKGASTPTGWVFQISSADKLVFTDTSTSITGTTSIAANTWTYVAVVRAGTGANQTTLYVNGTSDGTGTSATNFNQTSNMLIGADRSTTNFANGYISNLRLSNTNRTISSTPTTALTADANTIFLSLNLNRFQYIDSTATYTNISVTGTPSVVAFSPFNPTSSWSAATNGGSGYFDGSGDYLSAASNAAFTLGSSSDFCIEGWIYSTGTPGTDAVIAGTWQNGSTTFANRWLLSLRTSGTAIYWWDSTGSPGITYTGITTNQWVHIAVVRNSGTITLYVNGVSRGTQTTNQAYTTQDSLKVGGGITGTSDFPGYISSLRVVLGSPVYTTAFTPPTAPLTAITNTSLLLNFTNAGIYDATSKNDLETVGDAQISNAVTPKWGSTSIKFDGTGDYLQIPANQLIPFASAEKFTIEGWVNFSAATAGQIYGIYSSRGNTGTSYGITISAAFSPLKLYVEIANSTTPAGSVTSSTTITTGLGWIHFAAVYDGTQLKLYINGTSEGTPATTSQATTLNTAVIGRYYTNVDNYYFNGYIQDLRITKGYARYTANFTAPTAAFPTL